MRMPLLHCLLMVKHPFLRPLGAVFVWCLWCALTLAPAYAKPSVDLKLEKGSSIVFCDASLSDNAKHISRILHEGTEVTFVWEINIDAVRQYWLNQNVATVQVERRVVPDLVSQSWQLIDVTSGISRRVFDVKQALDFLTHLQHFPVIDRSLLEVGKPYRMTVSLEEREGADRGGWLSRLHLWGYNTLEKGLNFTLP